MVILKKLALVVVCAAGLAYGLSFGPPPAWEVTREVRIAADSDEIHGLVGDLDQWPSWSPWCRTEDGTLQLTSSGSSIGVGATCQFEGRKLGKGTIRITSSDPGRGLSFDVQTRANLEQLKGSLVYEYLPGGFTRVRFTLNGDASGSPIGRYLGRLHSYTKGPVVVDSLSRLKKLCEAN
jgi:hypothetical protein